MTSEREFIRRLQARFPTRHPVRVGIGDDGAVVDCSDVQQQVVVTDMLLDNVHFDLQTTSPKLVGRKAVAVNLSDLAAMACWPTAAFLSIAIPRALESPEHFLEELYEGVEELAKQFQFTIAGGDTNAWDGPFAINVALTGVPMGSHAILRSGAEPGDKLFVTGPLGGSLKSGRHLTFEPRLHTALWLTENVDIHAMMDISDGLSVDLHRLMEASDTSALLYATCIPVHADIEAGLPSDARLHRAFSDGEDFELLLAVSPDDAGKLHASKFDFHVIGSVTACGSGPEILLEDSIGDRSVLPESGWQHS